MKMEQSVPKRRHIKFVRRGITQREEYDKHKTRKFEIKNLVNYVTNETEKFQILTRQPCHYLQIFRQRNQSLIFCDVPK